MPSFLHTLKSRSTDMKKGRNHGSVIERTKISIDDSFNKIIVTIMKYFYDSCLFRIVFRTILQHFISAVALRFQFIWFSGGSTYLSHAHIFRNPYAYNVSPSKVISATPWQTNEPDDAL